MPSKKHKRPGRGLAYMLLALIILVCGFMLRSTAPVTPTGVVLATAKPMDTPTPPPATAPPTPAPTPEPTEVTMPVIAFDPEIGEPTVLATDPGSALLLTATATATPTAQATATPTSTPTGVPPTATPQSFLLDTIVSATQEAEVTPSSTPTGREKASFILENLMSASPATETATPTVAPTVQITPSPTPVITPVPTEKPPAVVLSATATPRPGPTPTYEYTNDAGVRIEITRHAQEKLVYFATEIWLTDITQLRSAFSSDKFNSATEPVQDIAVRNNALLAFNGDFATFNDGGIIIRNGDVYRTNRSTRQMLVIDRNGDFIPYVDPPENAEEAAAEFHDQNVWHTLIFGPVLVENGQPVELPKSFFINTKGAKEPRTAIAQLGPLHYLLLVVDGRQDDYSRGVSLPELQEMFLEYGVETAFNLDGGGSTTLVFHGNVLNEPANGGQRHVPDILYIGY